MNINDLKLLGTRIQSLSVFRALLSDAVISALCEYINSLSDDDKTVQASKYAEFVSRLYMTGEMGLGKYILGVVNNDENVYNRTVGKGNDPSPALKKCVKCELETLQMISDLSSDSLKSLCGFDFLPDFENPKVNLAAVYSERIANIGKCGYGIYAKNKMFYIDTSGHIVPVRNPDRTRLSQLVDYEREKKIIVDNTKALLDGKPAANILLTGDAGTGKSSTVKAVVNEFFDEGLRILEVRKEQLHTIPTILDEISENPLKFILFIDDLSFSSGDDDFSALKAMLEGSVSAKSLNVVIYATSNRRHLIKEKFSDREGDDIHRNDTMQEIISLSERFGIHISFMRPDKKVYLDIVHHLAEEKNITMPQEELDLLAERFALERGNRSARAAKQFVEGIASK